MFKILLGLSALFVAICGGFFSVKGIALLFSGSFWATAVMASSLEFGKIMATSFLYRYWNTINKVIRIYLTCAVVILMGITSLGVYGFLSQAFYSSKSKLDNIEGEIKLVQEQKLSLNNQIKDSNDRLKILLETRQNQEKNLNEAFKQSTTKTISKSSGFFGGEKKETVTDNEAVKLKDTSLKSLQSNISNLDNNIQTLQNNLNQYNNTITPLDAQLINLNSKITSSDIGSFKFIAEAFNIKIDNVVKWFIFIIVAVFDPLAVCLVIAYNSVSNNKKEENIIIKPKPEIIPEVKKPVEIIKEIYKTFYKRGTKKTHNPELADPGLQD
jgi:predicted PurR-regulated permease PerM